MGKVRTSSNELTVKSPAANRKTRNAPAAISPRAIGSAMRRNARRGLPASSAAAYASPRARVKAGHASNATMGHRLIPNTKATPGMEKSGPGPAAV